MGTNVPRPPDLLNHAGDFSITPVTCLLVFGNSLDVQELINVTFGGVLKNSRVKAREYRKASVLMLMAALVERAEGLLIGRKFPVCINTADFHSI